MSSQRYAFEKKIFPYAVIFCIMGVFTACSGNTQYHLSIDARSFIEEDNLSGATTVSTTSGLAAYLLPLFEFLEETAIPDTTIQRGIAVQLPIRNPPDEVRLRFEALLMLELRNLSESAQLPGASLSLYLAAVDADDIYTQGSQVWSLIIPAISPGSRATIDFHPVICQGDPGYEHLRAGRFRAGIKVVIPAASGVSVNFSYDLQELTISLSGYPFGLVP